MNTPLRVAIFGVTGRMGRALIAAADEHGGIRVTGALASARSDSLGADVGVLVGGDARGVEVVADADKALEQADVAVDFSLPLATSRNLDACVAARCSLVLGTTGHDAVQRERIALAARDIAILAAPNMSLGVNLLLKLVELAARTLDESYDIEVYEAHHRHKKDAPSGTALALGGAAAASRGLRLEEVTDLERQGARGAGRIGFSVFRGGDVVGDHTVTFAGIGERIELTHRASDRMAFARGAVRGATWLQGRAPGLYSMEHVLGLSAIVDS
jgi:4-hydroxy-tetrahydrodipicolinate reductase